MGRRAAATSTLASMLVLAVLTGCGPRTPATQPTVEPSSPAPSPNSSLNEDESGPDSPIAYGFRVPRGASQVGPLVRYRSAKLKYAYQPELDAAQARKDADEQRKWDNSKNKGTPRPVSNPTATPAPTRDTFRLLGEPPKPDVTVSLMRINGNPTTVVRAMLAQIDVILPKAGIVRNDISRYCEAVETRITSCRLSARGTTHNGRRLQVTFAVDPGDLQTRTSPPGAHRKPVMYLRIAYIGNPRDGQANRRFDSNVDVPAGVASSDTSGLIWPGMDLDATRSTRLLNDWRAPREADLLLSAFRPSFAVVSTDKALDASAIAQQYAESVQAEPTVDVVEDLNEVTTTYTAVAPNGDRAIASYVLSARGYYAVLFWNPAPTPATAQPSVSAVPAAAAPATN